MRFARKECIVLVPSHDAARQETAHDNTEAVERDSLRGAGANGRLEP